MKAGDLVRCKLWGDLGVIIEGRHGPGGAYLTRVLWHNDSIPRLAHIAHLEVIEPVQRNGCVVY
jgi:hypothetical protein